MALTKKQLHAKPCAELQEELDKFHTLHGDIIADNKDWRHLAGGDGFLMIAALQDDRYMALAKQRVAQKKHQLSQLEKRRSQAASLAA